MTQPTTPPPGAWQPTNPPAPPVAKRSWFARHKILTALLGLVVLGIVVSTLGGGGDDKSGTAGGSSASASSEATASASSAASAAATPAPAPSRAAPAGIGTQVRDGKFEFTVTGVDDGGKQVGNEYLKETAQGTFKLVRITVTNIGDKPQMLFDSNQKITDDQGRQFSPNSTAAIYLDENNKVWITEINPGNTVSGTLVFDMPEGSTPVSIELHDSAFSGGVKVALQ